ncbi:SGNH hydrolase-type esterase domain-containing protein [Trichoderma asperelloides]|nr:SGNH hydrolase-type esterase domain-containing protein [Trichoderma asperelloides]
MGSNSTSQGHWVHTWASMPMIAENDNLPPDDFIQENVVFRNTTIRQTMRVSIGTEKLLRIRLSNAFGSEPLTIAETTLALATKNESGTTEIESQTIQNVTFGGSGSTTIPARTLMVSDNISFGFPLQSNTVLTISFFLEAGHNAECITTHPGSRTTSYFTKGNRVSEGDFNHLIVRQTDHWYYISGLEVFASQCTRAFALIGDSITDGRCSLTNGDTRCVDLLDPKLDDTITSKPHTSLAVVNQAAGGNRVLDDGLGPSVLSRLDRDIISLSGASSVLIFEGVNDIGMAPADSWSQKILSNRLIAAYKQVAIRLRAHGIAIFAATLTPFSLPQTDLRGRDTPITSYSHPVRESTRQIINNWIRTSGIFDVVVDFDEILRDPADHSLLKREYDSGDGLHPNQNAFYAMADYFPIHVFENLF